MMGRGLYRWIGASLLGAVFYASAQTTTYVSDDFRGATATNWTFTASQGDGAMLTGNGAIDPDGEGWLRLTSDKVWQSSFVYYNDPIPTGEGLVFTFDFVIWGSHRSIADGFALVLFDAAVTPEAGAYGGSLGYAQRRVSGVDTFGLAGGIAGIGFDVFGNYSRASEGRIGGPGNTPNSIAIRGSMGATRMNGYEYVTGTPTLTNAFSTASASGRDDATIHTVRISIDPEKTIQIEWHDGDGNWETVIGPYECELTCPEEIRFGFTAGTGSYSANHEIRNLSVTNIPEPGSVLLLGVAAAAGLWIRRRFVD